MATTTAIKFYKGKWGATTANANSLANAGGIYFDETSKQIYVNGVAYGGAITDATFADSKLTITKVGADPIVLDFSDTASAASVYHVFTHMNNLIGTATEDETLTAEYAGTHYLTSAANLIGADKALDTAIYELGTRIDNLSTSNVETVTKTVNAETGETTLTFKGVSETGGVVEVGTRADSITLKKVATTGNAVDVAVADTAGVFVGTNVEDVLLEISSKISDSNLSINGQVGQFTTDKTMITVDGTHKVLGVNTTGYIGTTEDGIDLVASKVDTAGTSTEDTDLATVKTVKTYIGTEIAALNVTEYAQAEIASNGESFSVYGIKEEDGKIVKGAGTVTLNFGSVYNANDNKVALVSNITDAIEGLDTTQDVQAVVYTAASGNDGAKLTFKGVSETDGVIAQGAGTAELTFAKVATTGKAEDITFTNGDYIGSNLEQAVNDMDERIESLEALPKYDVQVVDALPADPGKDNMHIIYLMAEAGQAANDAYGEYIVVRKGTQGDYTYSYEKLGTTKADLQGYVKSVVVNGKTYEVPSKGTQITLTDVITSITDGDDAITTDSKYTGDYINTEVTVISTKDTTAGTNIAQVTSAAKVKVQEMSTADGSSSDTMGLAEASDVKTYIGSRVQELNVAETSVTGTNVSFKYKETNGVVEIGTLVVDYATVRVGTTAGQAPTMTVTDGTKLAVGSDIQKGKEYTDAKVAYEISQLDSIGTSSATGAVARVEVAEQDGRITAVNVTNISAGVAYTAADGNNPANIAANNTTGAVTGADIATIKQYVDAASTSINVQNAQATIPVGTDVYTVLGTVVNTPITAKVSFTWEEYN